jgi:hypothetical protein
VAVQSLQVAPNDPQVELLEVMHFPAWQQPERQLRALQLPEPLELPDDDDPLELPDEEPLDEPDEEPLELPDDDELLDDPLDDPEELDDVPPLHAPALQVPPVAVQSMQLTPSRPHAESSRPTLQLPLASQQPPHTAAHPVTASSPPSSPASSTVASPVSSPLEDPPELVLPAPLLLRPTPLVLPELLPLELPDEVLVPASTLGLVVGVESSLAVSKPLPVPLAAHAATVTSATAIAT